MNTCVVTDSGPPQRSGGTSAIDELEPYSLQMASDLLAAFPDWAPWLSIVSRGGVNCFRVEVPPPHGRGGDPIGVTSLFNDAITVSFASWHGHFASMLPSPEDPQGAIACIRPLMNEEWVVVESLCSGDSLIKDGVFSASALPVADVPQANHEYPYVTARRIRSWKGSFNREFPAPYVRTNVRTKPGA